MIKRMTLFRTTNKVTIFLCEMTSKNLKEILVLLYFGHADQNFSQADYTDHYTDHFPNTSDYFVSIGYYIT